MQKRDNVIFFVLYQTLLDLGMPLMDAENAEARRQRGLRGKVKYTAKARLIDAL